MSPVDSDATLPFLVEKLASETPDAVALIDAVTEAKVSYRDFASESKAWARHLAALEIGAGDTIATMMGPTFDAYYVWLGLSALAAIEVPINPQLQGRTLKYLLNHSGARVLLVQASVIGQVAEISSDLESLEIMVVTDRDAPDGDLPDLPFRVLYRSELRGLQVDVDYHRAQRHNTACIIYTSGTTGPPKGVVIPWGWLSISTEHLPERVQGGTRYSYLSPAHMSGKGALTHAFAERRTLVLREAFSVRNFWTDIEKYNCTVSQLFPAMVKYLLTEPARAGDEATPLQHVWMAPLIPEVRDFMDRFGVAVTTGYGMTEIGGPIHGPDIDGTNLEAAGTVNPDPRGYEVRIVDEFDREVATGEIGELIVRTSEPWTLNAGYFRAPEATAEAWRNGWFHTGDALRQDEDGQFYFVDRFKDCIRRKGENISSFEVEGYALEYPGVAEAAAVGVPSPDGEQEVKIFVVESESGNLDPEKMGAWLAEKMPRFMTPRYLEVVLEFPRTPATGRVQKGTLRSQAAGSGEWDRLAAAHGDLDSSRRA